MSELWTADTRVDTQTEDTKVGKDLVVLGSPGYQRSVLTGNNSGPIEFFFFSDYGSWVGVSKIIRQSQPLMIMSETLPSL